MSHRSARYELRVWLDDDLAGQLAALAERERRAVVHDRYLLVDRRDRNVKIRRGHLEVKVLVGERHGLQRWAKCRSQRRFADPLGGAASVPVRKWRRRFRVGCVRAESSVVEIEPAGLVLRTVVLESEAPEAVLRLRDDLGLSGHPNLAVPTMLAEVCGDGSPARSGS